MSEEKKTPQSTESTEPTVLKEEETHADEQRIDTTTDTAIEEAALEEKTPTSSSLAKEDAVSPKKRLGGVLASQKVRRRGISTVFTAIFLAVIILLNVIVSMLSTRYPSINLDLSAQKTNTLTEDAVKVIDSIKLPTTITILGPENDVRDNVMYSGYGFNYSQVAILSDKIKERNSNITVKYVDLDKNPTYASELQEANLSAGCVVVSTEKRHRVLQITDLFNTQTDYTTGQATSYSMVGTALASAISQVNSTKLPVIAFATGHEEIYDSSALQNVLKNANFETVSFNILTDAIPANAQMVMLASPATDYTPQELKKLDAFLENAKLTTDRSLLITFYPSQEALPNLSAFLKEWGIEVPRAVVVERDQTHIAQSNASFILTQTNVASTVTLNPQVSQYENVVMPESSPINLLFTSRDGVTTHSLATSYNTSYLVDSKSTEETVKNAKQQAYTTVALAQKNMSLDGTVYKQNVIVAGSSPMFAEGVINASAYGNGKYVADLIRYATGETDSNTGLLVTPVQTNQVDINLSQAASMIIGFGLFTVFIPLCVLAAGFVVFLKRRHL
ncbi:GldG family protein [Clostridium merdae]|uniref:GldG family protein n=1 Tax=Clostridium merdae TaxID=1958780 RepID=UPI000A2671A1|nr:GldG family protein [Clostridium merdae]